MDSRMDCNSTIRSATKWIEKYRTELSTADMDALRRCAEDLSNQVLKLTDNLLDCTAEELTRARAECEVVP